MLLLPLLLLAGCCGAVPLVVPSGDLKRALSTGRQVAPSQHILGELQQLFRQAVAGQQSAEEYNAVHDDLQELVSSLDQLAAVVPLGQQDPGTQQADVSTTTAQSPNVPIIDPGLFVIQGVQTCGAGAGYCMLGHNCSADTDFSTDPSGHCDGLRGAFTPPADFSCCRFEASARLTATPRPTPTTTEGTTFDDGLIDSIVNFGDEVPEKPNNDSSQIVDIVAIITDSTGIVDIVTRPYTGPWPPLDDQADGGVTLPFAKPGETFEPGSLVGLGQNVNLGTTPATPDAFQAGDLPPEEEQQTSSSAAPGADLLLTTAATTAATPGDVGPTPAAAAESTAGDPLGPLAAVPVMDQSLDYIGEVDYDQHLMPALMPIRPGTKADGVQATIEGSGDGGDDDLLDVMDDSLLQEGSGLEALADGDTGHQQQQQQEDEAVLAASDKSPSSDETQNSAENEKQTTAAAAVAVQLEAIKQESETRWPADSGAESASAAAAGSVAPSSGGPAVCGVMGSSLATLLARNRFRPRGDDSAVGGEVTSAVVWCWMAAVMRKTHDPDNPYSFVCSGTLVERDLVVTTASCAARLFQEPLRNFVVLLGASNLRVSLEFGVQHMELDEIIVHEDYQLNNHVPANNIGLLKLSRPAVLERTVCLLCLPPETMELTGRQSCSVTGYGSSDSRQSPAVAVQDSSPDLAGVLLQTSMAVLPRSLCRLSGAMQRLAAVDPTLDDRAFLCAGGRRAVDACHMSRDGGSPLACMADTGRYYLYGYVSWDGECRDDAEPQLYTNVASFFTWIRDNYRRMTRTLPQGTR